MKIAEKRIYFVMSPHINYYHSFRGDSIGTDGFGLDLQIMENLVSMVESCEQQGLCDGKIPISWDYSDLFWTVQLQRKFQPDVLNRVIQRCNEQKDEIVMGTWGNSILPGLDTEEFLQQSKWLLENQMGIGLNQLFPGRIAPYIRTQETMFTQGMIELFNQVGVQGILNYYTVIPFDTTRPLLNPPLNWNQRYGILNFHSTLSDAHILMIPMYGFGDMMDHLSIEKWLRKIRKKQESGEITGHALVVLNHDMDSYTWNGTHLPKLLQWMPNIGGIPEIIKTVDKLSYVQFTTLLDIIPQLTPQGDVTLYPDVADGCFNGYYNWAQKYDNTKYWTLGQQARWLKAASDSLIENQIISSTPKITSLLRSSDDRVNSYIKNKILFASTTNFGMSMPFNHPHRQKTALKYGVSAYKAAEEALMTAIDQIFKKTTGFLEKDQILILPISTRGSTKEEHKEIPAKLLIASQFSRELLPFFETMRQKEPKAIRVQEDEGLCHVQFMSSRENFQNTGYFLGSTEDFCASLEPLESNSTIFAGLTKLENEFLSLHFNPSGKITSLMYQDQEFAAPNFLDSSISFGKKGSIQQYRSKEDRIEILEDGSNHFCASIRIASQFALPGNHLVSVEKTLTVYKDLSNLFISVKMHIPEIAGTATSDSNVYSVKVAYDDRWQEIMPCEVRPGFTGLDHYLRVWKHNFLGKTTYFDLDLEEVDPKNSDVDCLVGNISDGWMAVSNQTQGLMIGFNSIKAANFAFSPVKWKKDGFGDMTQSGQQIRINPFGTYYGKMLHHWGTGTGHAQQIVPSYSSTFKSTAPTFSGRTVSFDLTVSPYLGDRPPEVMQNTLNHFSFPPLILVWDATNQQVHHNFAQIQHSIHAIIEEYDIETLLEMPYLEWVKQINENHVPEQKRRDDLNLSLKHLLTLFFDGIRSKF